MTLLIKGVLASMEREDKLHAKKNIRSLSIYNRVIGPWAYWQIYKLLGVVYGNAVRCLYIESCFRTVGLFTNI